MRVTGLGSMNNSENIRGRGVLVSSMSESGDNGELPPFFRHNRVWGHMCQVRDTTSIALHRFLQSELVSMFSTETFVSEHVFSFFWVRKMKKNVVMPGSHLFWRPRSEKCIVN